MSAKKRELMILWRVSEEGAESYSDLHSLMRDEMVWPPTGSQLEYLIQTDLREVTGDEQLTVKEFRDICEKTRRQAQCN